MRKSQNSEKWDMLTLVSDSQAPRLPPTTGDSLLARRTARVTPGFQRVPGEDWGVVLVLLPHQTSACLLHLLPRNALPEAGPHS